MKSKRPLLKIGLILFVVSFIVNGIFMYTGIGGLLRELSRLGALVGLFTIIVGFFYRKKKSDDAQTEQVAGDPSLPLKCPKCGSKAQSSEKGVRS